MTLRDHLISEGLITPGVHEIRRIVVRPVLELDSRARQLAVHRVAHPIASDQELQLGFLAYDAERRRRVSR